MSYIGKKNGNPNTDFLEAGGELENHDLVNVDSNGKVTSFTSTGIDDNATSTAMTLDSSGNLLVGKTSAGFANTGHEMRGGGSYASFTRDGGTPVLMNRKTSDGAITEFMKDGTAVGSIGTGYGVVDIKGGSAGLLMGNSSVLPVNGSGTLTDNSYDIGASSFRFNDLYLGGGVYVGGTGSANYLDDYEEGTWTPSVSSGTVSVSYATYTKVGNRVHVSMEIQLGGTRGSEIFTVSGLPFGSSNYTAAAFYCKSYVAEGTQQATGYFRAGSADIRVNEFGVDAIGTQFGTGYFTINGTYRTS